MNKLSDTLLSIILSLRQISDRLKALITSSVTKSEATADKQEILDAVNNIPEPDLSSLAQQGTLVQGLTGLTQKIDILQGSDDEADLTSIKNDTKSLLLEIAKQGDNPDATNTAIYQLLQQEGIEHANVYAAEIRENIGDWTNE